jgi:hypothetical protein
VIFKNITIPVIFLKKTTAEHIMEYLLSVDDEGTKKEDLVLKLTHLNAIDQS